MKRSNLRDLLGLYREIMHRLNRLERQIFLLLLYDWTVADIARELHVTRPAIYWHIRGSGTRPTGMIHKNWYVAYWWHTRRNH